MVFFSIKLLGSNCSIVGGRYRCCICLCAVAFSHVSSNHRITIFCITTIRIDIVTGLIWLQQINCYLGYQWDRSREIGSCCKVNWGNFARCTHRCQSSGNLTKEIMYLEINSAYVYCCFFFCCRLATLCEWWECNWWNSFESCSSKKSTILIKNLLWLNLNC